MYFIIRLFSIPILWLLVALQPTELIAFHKKVETRAGTPTQYTINSDQLMGATICAGADVALARIREQKLTTQAWVLNALAAALARQVTIDNFMNLPGSPVHKVLGIAGSTAIDTVVTLLQESSLGQEIADDMPLAQMYRHLTPKPARRVIGSMARHAQSAAIRYAVQTKVAAHAGNNMATTNVVPHKKVDWEKKAAEIKQSSEHNKKIIAQNFPKGTPRTKERKQKERETIAAFLASKAPLEYLQAPQEYKEYLALYCQ